MPAGPMADRIRSTGVTLYSLEVQRGSADLRAIGRLQTLLRRIRPAALMSLVVSRRRAGSPVEVARRNPNAHLESAGFRPHYPKRRQRRAAIGEGLSAMLSHP